MLTVIAPIEGTPADKAGVKAGDKIIKIDDKSTKDMTLIDAVGKTRQTNRIYKIQENQNTDYIFELRQNLPTRLNFAVFNLCSNPVNPVNPAHFVFFLYLCRMRLKHYSKPPTERNDWKTIRSLLPYLVGVQGAGISGARVPAACQDQSTPLRWCSRGSWMRSPSRNSF